MVLTACGNQSAPTVQAPVVAVKQLATVQMPPTLSPVERQATFQALPRTPSPPPPSPTPTETAYVGVFLGEVSEENVVFQPPEITALPDESACEIPIDSAFGDGWSSNPSIARRMGCPIQARFGFSGEVQVFEGGVMYRRPDLNAVWAVTPGSLDPGQYWYVENPPVVTVEGIIPPDGLRLPTDVLGSVWLSNAEVRETLGYARTPNQVADINIQRFEGGSLLLDVTVGQVFVLLVNGDAYGPY